MFLERDYLIISTLGKHKLILSQSHEVWDTLAGVKHQAHCHGERTACAFNL